MLVIMIEKRGLTTLVRYVVKLSMKRSGMTLLNGQMRLASDVTHGKGEQVPRQNIHDVTDRQAGEADDIL